MLNKLVGLAISSRHGNQSLLKRKIIHIFLKELSTQQFQEKKQNLFLNIICKEKLGYVKEVVLQGDGNIRLDIT